MRKTPPVLTAGLIRWSRGNPMRRQGVMGGDALLAYDPGADRWQARASLPRPLHHATASAVGGLLYVVGGYTEAWNPVDTVFEYNPATDRWHERARMPTARGALAAGVIDGRIHAVGCVGRDRRNTDAHDVYDPLRDRWARGAPLPTPRDHLA